MTIRWLAIVFPLAPGGHLRAGGPTADTLKPPIGRIEMALDSDMFNEVDDQFALAFAVRSPERIELKAVYAAPFLNQRSKPAGDGMADYLKIGLAECDRRQPCDHHAIRGNWKRRGPFREDERCT